MYYLDMKIILVNKIGFFNSVWLLTMYIIEYIFDLFKTFLQNTGNMGKNNNTFNFM